MSDRPISRLPETNAIAPLDLLILSQRSSTIRIAATTLSAQASDQSYNDSGNGFLTAGFAVNDYVNVVGFTGNVANNIQSGQVTALTAGKMTIGGPEGSVIVDDAAGESVVISKWVSRYATAETLRKLIHSAPTTIAGTAHTATLDNAYGYLRFTAASPVVLTVPPQSSVPWPEGAVIAWEQSGVGSLSFIGGAGVTINSEGGGLIANGQFAVGQLKRTGENQWTLIGSYA